jgi:hypothetical protein
MPWHDLHRKFNVAFTPFHFPPRGKGFVPSPLGEGQDGGLSERRSKNLILLFITGNQTQNAILLLFLKVYKLWLKKGKSGIGLLL